jgi:hypothetical protein
MKKLLFLFILILFLSPIASAQFVGHPSRTAFFILDDPSISEGTDDSVYIQYPIWKDNYDKVWYHYNPSAQNDQYDTLIFSTNIPMWFVGFDSITYNYKTSNATSDTTNAGIKTSIFTRSVDGGARTILSTQLALAGSGWIHTVISAATVTAG